MVRRSFARAFAASPLIFPPNKPPATQVTAAAKTSLIKWNKITDENNERFFI